MNIMFLQRKKENPFIICCLAALTLVLCGRSKRLTTASASTDETSKETNHGGSHVSDLLSSLYGKNAEKTAVADASDGAQTIQLTEDQLNDLAAALSRLHSFFTGL